MIETLNEVKCFHCGQPCEGDTVYAGDKSFCCVGCKVVFELINENNLCEYYNIESHPGLNARSVNHSEYDELNDPKIRKKLLEFEAADFARIRFRVPSIHCSSCIWLLESLHRVDSGVLRSEVNFHRKEVCIDFDPGKTRLSKLAGLLDALGYAPVISTEAGQVTKKRSNRQLVLKLGVAGFAFGNVMLFSFPEYLGLDPADGSLGRLFSILNLALSVPVIVFSAQEYFTSAIKSFRQKQINIDVPIALGLLALFFRSTFDIITGTGPGYLDSFTGLVFFLLIGRWFQGRTYDSLSFERDFKSYFPLAVQRVKDRELVSTVIYELKKGDNIRIRNLEIVPADSILIDNSALIDYSFVTGESRPVKVAAGDLVYAGGRLIGKPALFVVEKQTAQSHLTGLWNRDAFRKKYENQYRKVIDRSARIFTWIVMGIALLTAVYWYFYQPAQMWLVLTSVLMVACPCALALAAPFTYGSMLRAFGRNGFYLKNADVIERLGVINSVVFDKTGTITYGEASKGPSVEFMGKLTPDEFVAVKLLTSYSTHPLSNLVNRSIAQKAHGYASYFTEQPGKGIEGIINGKQYRVGSGTFVGAKNTRPTNTAVFVAIDDDVKGYFLLKTSIRTQIRAMLSRLGQQCAAMISGDNDSDIDTMKKTFPATTSLLFNQQPGDKMEYIAGLQRDGKKVLMVGDGLNDAGALKQADVGVAVTDDAGLFTPGCDGILAGNELHRLDKFLLLARKSTTILKAAFAISFIYNAIALTFAVTGNLTPLVAAILMPISSISVVGFSTIAVNASVKKML